MESPSQFDDVLTQEGIPIPPQQDSLSAVFPTSNLPILPGTPSHSTQSPNLAPRGSHLEKRQLTNTKVAIPRQRPSIVPRYGRRVSLACESCRQRKKKCSGNTPICRQCEEFGVDCRYPVSWTERTKGQLRNLSTKIQVYEGLLRDIGNFVDGRTAERIRNILEKVTEVNQYSTHSESSSHTIILQDEETPDDVSSPSSIGSLEAIDRVEEDVNRNPKSRATGYMGKSSEVTWMQRLRKEAEQRSRKLAGTYEAQPADEFPLHSMNYHLDDMEISIPGPVQAYKMPPRPVADQLFNDYLNTTHPSFPIISRTLFQKQYRTFFDSAARPGDKWLAILNLIFAIAAKHAHLTQAPWRGEDNDHLVYLTRARILSMSGDVLFSHPDLQQVQVEGLTAYYLLASDQINRAWRIAALAVRSSVSLGLNVKNTTEGTTGISKEARYKVWWCLYTFENMLGIMTGRVTCISGRVCTTPLPLPFEEEQLSAPDATKILTDPDLRQGLVESALACSCVWHVLPNPQGGQKAKHTDKLHDISWLKSQSPSSALVFLYYVDLAVIVQDIVNRVYSLDCATVPWAHIESRIGELRARIDLWYSDLPEAYDFTRKEDPDLNMLRGRLFLAFHYHSSRITLGRPCLCRRNNTRQGTSPNKKPSFSHEMAVITLDSARQMLDLVPDVPNVLWLYQICPWWCILHYIMQAATALLLELSFGSIHMPDEEKNVLEAVKKAVRWLFAMSEFSFASFRAWELCDNNLQKIAIGMDYDVSDIPKTDHSSKINRPADTDPANSGQLNNTHPAPVFYDAVEDPTQQEPNTPLELPQGTLQYNQSQRGYSGVPTGSTMPLPNSPVSPVSNAHFPYDPISGEFIRSFFPTFYDEEPWDQVQDS